MNNSATNQILKERFRQFLIEHGYKQYSKNGNRSTAYDYPNRIEFVCKQENLTWSSLAECITEIRTQYDIGGIKQSLGKISKNSVINALSRFEEFIKPELRTSPFHNKFKE